MLSFKGIKNKPLTVTVLLGASAGFVNGLLGAGGGILIVLALKKILKKESADEKEIFANSLAIMLPVSVFSAFLYAARGNISLVGFDAFIIPAILGGIFGAILLGKLKPKVIRMLFGVLVIVSGILMIIN
ncbi:MAG: sulfite exporter TauE/SafE family protein [Clostridia bacterium]|nr:sulfite exporter TauE/SafE family protein [Clostridia bacterium]